MGKTFVCLKETTWRGRQVRAGETITVRDDVSISMNGHPCWKAAETEPDPTKTGKK